MCSALLVFLTGRGMMILVWIRWNKRERQKWKKWDGIWSSGSAGQIISDLIVASTDLSIETNIWCIRGRKNIRCHSSEHHSFWKYGPDCSHTSLLHGGQILVEGTWNKKNVASATREMDEGWKDTRSRGTYGRQIARIALDRINWNNLRGREVPMLN